MSDYDFLGRTGGENSLIRIDACLRSPLALAGGSIHLQYIVLIMMVQSATLYY